MEAESVGVIDFIYAQITMYRKEIGLNLIYKFLVKE